MGQIVFNGQKPKYCNLTAITTGSKKDYLIPDGEIWLIDSTNTSKTDGTGKYDYYIKGDGSNTASQLAANKIKVDDSIDISGKADKSEMSVVAGTGANADKTTITLKSGTSATVLTQHQDVSGKEDKSNKVTSFSSPTDTQYPSAKLVNDQLATKQGTISDLSTIRSGASAGATAYQKPGTGIPKTDLASAVQTSLGKADTAIQSVTVGTTTTGAAGTNASVTNTGTATAPVLNFTIPQGAQGVKGDTVIMGGESSYTLYNTTGDAVDGAMTQQAVTRELTELAGSYIDNSEWITVAVDKDGRILYGIKADGSIEWSVGVPQPVREYVAQKIEELSLDEYGDIVAFLGANIEGHTLNELLNLKVDKVEGKGLSTNDFTDVDKEVVETEELIENTEWMYVLTDNDYKIIEGIKADGTKEVYTDVKFNGDNVHFPSFKNQFVDNSNYIEIKTDCDYKIIEGITKDGKKIIGDFDESTRLLIKQIANDGNLPNKISIPLLDANFVSPIPCIIDGTKGDDDAKYSFTLPLQNDAYNIRFKFKITENILNQNKTSVIAKFGGVNAVVATPVKLNQLLASSTYQGEVKMMYWPSLRGGIRLNGSSVARTTDSGDKQNIGNFAFYVKYTGESTNVTIENTGQALIIKVDGVATNLSFSTYQSVAELYEAVKSLADFEVSYNEIETRQCSELATFSECVLVSKYYTGVNGGKNDPIEEYYDTAPFFIPYAVSEDWHQVEIVKIGESVYVCVDGLTTTIVPNDNILSLGGECGCLFKELEVDTTSSSDAEFIDGVLISSVNPHIIIHEGHDIIQTPTNEIVSPSGNLGTTVDRLQLVYSKMIGKGYVPVSVDEIADYYAGNRLLPKRCFTSIFDDYRWVNCLDLSNRSVFTRLGIKPGFAVITSDQSPIEHNGNIITPQEAATICRHYQFGLYSHTRNHRDNYNIKPSTYFSELIADVYDGDIKGIDNSIFVYPYGHVYTYMTDVMKWLGFRLGINIQRGGVNIKNRSRFNLTRIEIGVTENITDIFNSII